MGAKHSKPKRTQISTDGEHWYDANFQCRCVVIPQTFWQLMPGLLSMRLPRRYAAHWEAGRRIDGKRARWRTVENSVPIAEYPSIRHKYGSSN